MRKLVTISGTACLLTLFLAAPGLAQTKSAEDDPVGLVPTDADAAKAAAQKSYSPYAQRNFPTRAYWGDTHVHTDNSLDARGFGVTLDVATAFRFARGEEVISSHGIPFKLPRHQRTYRL